MRHHQPQCPQWPAPDRPAVAARAAAMSPSTSLAKAQRAQENRAYVRRLLWQRQPAFAAALAAALVAVEEDFSCPACARRTGASGGQPDRRGLSEQAIRAVVERLKLQGMAQARTGAAERQALRVPAQSMTSSCS
jgi:hypothetical protein